MDKGRPEVSFTWLKDTVKSRLMVAGCLYWASVNIASMDIITSPFPFSGAPWIFYCALLVGNTFAFVACLLFARRFSPLSDQRAFRLVSSGLLAVSGCLLLQSFFSGNTTVYAVSGFLDGMGTGFVFVFFAERFSPRTVYEVLFQAGAQITLGAVFALLLSFLPLPLRILFVIVEGPIANYLIGTTSLQSSPLPEKDEHPCLSGPAVRTLLFLSPLFVGVAVGVMRLSLLDIRQPLVEHFFIDTAFAFAGGFLLMLATLYLYRSKVYEYLYLIGFPLIAIGLVTAPLAQFGYYIGLYALLAGLSFFYGLLWALCVQFKTLQDPFATHTAAKSFLSLQLGQLFGLVLFLALERPLQNLVWISVCSMLVLVLLIIRVFVAQQEIERSIRKSATELGLRANSISIAKKYGLTTKESEIYTLITQGLSTRQIEIELVVSANTVNSHIRHIFQKLGVHSRSELMALTLSEMSSTLDENRA